MAILSNLYSEKEVKTVNGFDYSLTDSVKNLWFPNEEIDNSIVYTKCLANSLKTASIDIDTGKNINVLVKKSYTKYPQEFVFNLMYSPEYSMQNVKLGYCLTYAQSSNFWNGFNPDKQTTSGTDGNTQFLRDFKINNIVFSVKIKGYNVADLNNIFTEIPENIQISLDDLIKNPENYLISDITFGAPVIFKKTETNTYEKITNTNIKIAVINMTEKSTGINLVERICRHESFTSNSPLTISVRNTNVNGDIGVTGSGYQTLYYDLSKWYSCDEVKDFEINFPEIDLTQYKQNTTVNLGYYELSNNSNSVIYCNKSVIIGYTASTDTSRINNALVKLYRLLKGKFVVNLLAGAGVYMKNFTHNIPDNINPENLYADPNIYLGKMDKNGLTTGEFISGNSLLTYDGWNKDGTTNNPNFNPNISTSGDDIDEIGINDFPFNYVGGLARYYAIDRFQLDELIADFKKSENGIPLDAGQFVIGLYQLPLDIPSFCTTSQEKIVLGKLETNAVGKKLLTVNRKTHLGEYFISANCGNNFLDYAPYTEIKLYIPFCGMVELPPNLFINSTVSVDMIIDIISGSCKGIVMCNNTFYTSINGSLMCGLPLSLEQCATKSLSIINSANSIMSGIIFGNKNYSALNTVTTLGEAMIENNNIAPSHISGNMDSVVNFYDPQCCILFMTYPEVNMGDIGKTHGKVCNYQDTLNNCHGYTVVNNPHLEIKCTNTEKDEITKLLEQGVILP